MFNTPQPTESILKDSEPLNDWIEFQLAQMRGTLDLPEPEMKAGIRQIVEDHLRVKWREELMREFAEWDDLVLNGNGNAPELRGILFVEPKPKPQVLAPRVAPLLKRLVLTRHA